MERWEEGKKKGPQKGKNNEINFNESKPLTRAFKFENLKVWQKALTLSSLVNEVAKKFTKHEMDVLTQFKRVADSVSLNIAAGSTGQSNDAFNRFPGIAIR